MTAQSPRSANDPVVVMIATILEQEHVDRIASVDPRRVRIIYRPDLQPPSRYVADHHGPSDWTRDPADETEFRSLLSQAEVLWDFADIRDAAPLELSPKLKWVQTSSAGVGQQVKKLGLQESDLIVTTASGVHGQPLTEFVFASLLFYTKRFPQLIADQKAHHWDRFCGGELAGKRMAVIGPGRIGREVARIAKAFNMEVWAMARSNDPQRADDLGVDRVLPRAQLHELLGAADCVVLATPHTPETENLIDRSAIAAMKPGVVLVNIARGIVIDEEAMIKALESGQIGFASLDVTRVEPLPASSPLWDLPNVLICPHSASTADTENSKIVDIFVHNLRCYLDGRIDEMTPVLDKMRLY